MQSSFFQETSSLTQQVQTEVAKVPGLVCHLDMLSIEEEKMLIRSIDREKWLSDLQRRVQHYGYKYDYKARKVDASMFLGELPLWSHSLCDRLVAMGWFSHRPDQLIVNEYEPGQGISPHVDCVPCFADNIVSVSLGGHTVMSFSPREKGRASEKIEVFLPPRSALLMREDARFEWKHGIAKRKTDRFAQQVFRRERRISLTFRHILSPA